MKRILILSLTVGAALALPLTTFAAKGTKPAKGEGKARPGKVLHEVDKNANHQIDGDEVDALKKRFESEPKGPLASLDKNTDGKLDDDEIKALNARMSKHAEKAGGKATGKKKKAAK